MLYDASIRRLPLRTVIDVRGDALSVTSLMRKLDLPVPDRPNRRSGADGAASVAWLGPRHWLVIAGPDDDEDRIFVVLAGAAPEGTQVTPVSDAFAGFAILGSEAPEVLAQASPLDLHNEAFPADGASFTEVFGQKGLVMRSAGGFELLVESSYGDYIADCLSRCGGSIV